MSKNTRKNVSFTNARHSITTCLLSMAALLACIGTANAQSDNFVAGRLLIKMTGNGSTARSGLPGVASMRPLAPTTAGARSTDSTAWFLADLDEDTTVEMALEELADMPGIESVEPDYIRGLPTPVEASSTGASSADPGHGDQYALQRISADRAWAINGGTTNVVVAVIDSGVQYDHPDLEAQIWMNTAESQNGMDDDGNGFVDDVAGWNFVADHNDPYDDENHGTHVAGIIAATRDNNQGIAGTANVSIMALKVLNAEGIGADSGIAAAIRYAADNGAHIINLSLGGGSTNQVLVDACAYATQRGCLVVGAAGNDGVDTVDFPANLDTVVAVAATDANDNIANFSNAGPGIELSAPGNEILSTLTNNNYGPMSGTSMATPYVAGVAALIKSANPSMTGAQLRDRLAATCDDIGNPGYDELFGHGRINAFRALGGEGGAPAPTPGNPNNGDDQFEDNDTMESSALITNGSYDLMCSDEDWFVLETNGGFSVTVESNQGDLDLVVLDGNGEVIGTSESTSSNEAVSGTTATGAVIVLVFPYEGQGGAYRLTVNGDGGVNQPIIPDDGFDTDFPVDDFFGSPIDNTIVVPVTCGAGAVQMFASIAVGFLGLGSLSLKRRRRVSRR